MTKDEVLKLTLEALENLINYDYSGQPDNGIDLAGAEAITAIKKALAQPDHIVDANKMAQPAQEPLTDKQRRNMVKKWLFDFAWDDPTERQIDDLEMLLIAGRNSAAHGITPQQRPWIRLTDEEIMRIINSNISTGLWCMAIEIEAKLKEKNFD